MGREVDTVAVGLSGRVGWSLGPGARRWRNGAFKRIDPAPLLVLSTVADVSETGVLVGETVTPDTKIHGYIARPTS
jgi:hypothetical protein